MNLTQTKTLIKMKKTKTQIEILENKLNSDNICTCNSKDCNGFDVHYNNEYLGQLTFDMNGGFNCINCDFNIDNICRFKNCPSFENKHNI